MKKTNQQSYNGYRLNPTNKGKLGFYVEQLQIIISLLLYAKQYFTKPRSAHLIIEAPKEEALCRLPQELNRWNESDDDTKPIFFACLETRPRARKRHLHILVVFQATEDCTYSLKTLQRRLKKLSKQEKVTLCRRAEERRPIYCDQSTGEIPVNDWGRPRRVGSPYFHNLSINLDDAFERHSYLAKVFTKDEIQKKGQTFSHSRLKRESSSESKGKTETKQDHSLMLPIRPIEYLECHPKLSDLNVQILGDPSITNSLYFNQRISQ